MRLRDATEADIAAITAIYNDVILTSDAIWLDEIVTVDDRLDWFRQQQADGGVVLVAVDDALDDEGDGGDTVVGYASLGRFRTKTGYWPTVEHSIHLADGYRGQGIGQALLDELVARATAQGRYVMVAGVDAGNVGSIRFHERNGFRIVATMPAVGRKFGCPVDLILMQRELRTPGDPA